MVEEERYRSTTQLVRQVDIGMQISQRVAIGLQGFGFESGFVLEGDGYFGVSGSFRYLRAFGDGEQTFLDVVQRRVETSVGAVDLAFRGDGGPVAFRPNQDWCQRGGIGNSRAGEK